MSFFSSSREPSTMNIFGFSSLVISLIFISASLSLAKPNPAVNQQPEYVTKRSTNLKLNFEIKTSLLMSIIKKIDKINKKLDGRPIPTDAQTKGNCTVVLGESCADLYKKGFKTDGIYRIDPDGQGSFEVRCDMTTRGGGWTIFQRRADGSQDFYRKWKDYKNGFGNLIDEFWLGLDKINRISSNKSVVLRFDLEDFSGVKKYAEYNRFAVTSEKSKYKLSLGSYSGTAGDSFTVQSGMAFSTKDSDNDGYSGRCAQLYKGGWWYNHCHYSNLNGIYHYGNHKSYGDGIQWRTWKGYHYSLKKTEMKVRPADF